MSITSCPIAYDHTDDLDECAACGWGELAVRPAAHDQLDLSALTGLEKIREAVDRLSGAYAPTQRVVICGNA